MRRGGFKAMVVGSSLGGLLMGSGLLLGCGGGGPPTVTERLWVSTVPTKPTETLTAFVTTPGSGRGSGDDYLGAFFHGTLYRGGHDVFQWKDESKNRARVKFLQDDRETTLTFETCKPSTGFDYCLKLKGDGTYKGKYQSRKRWVVRRPGRKRDAATGLVAQAFVELAEDDDELAHALDIAAEAAGIPGE